jgi:peptide/nickel transport system permease protein
MAEARAEGVRGVRRSGWILWTGVVLASMLVVVALAAPRLSRYPPDAIVVASYHGPEPPSAAHPLGTDTLGRDVWARLAFGARTSLTVGALGMALSLLLGVSVGLVAGYLGGWTDGACMWVVDLVLTMPSLLLLIVLATVLPPSLLTIPLVIGLVGWTTFARTVRGEVLSLRERDYVAAARALGASHGRVLARHLLPAVLPGIVALAALSVSGAVTIDAGLSYLGLGAPLPVPSWGRMVSEVQTYFGVAPWLVVLPGVAIALTVIAFNLIGYGLIGVIGSRRG